MGLFLHLIASIAGICVVWLAQTMGARFLRSSISNRANESAKARAQQHFLKAAELLTQSRSEDDPSESEMLAKEAVAEVERAISLDRLDAASHVLKALALQQQGLLQEALHSMGVALSPDIVDSLSPSEISDALMTRGGLLLAISKGRRNLDAAIADLQKSLEIAPDRPKALCMLALCYERNKCFAEAEELYKRALGLDPKFEDAWTGLTRLRP